MTNYQKFTKNIGFVGFTNFLVGLERIIVLPIITKLLGVENYGIWAQFGVTVGLISPLVILGLNSAILRFLAAEKDKKEIQEGVWSVLTITLVIGLIIVLLFMLFSKVLANFFQCETILIKILSFIIFFECLSLIFLSVFQVFQEISKYSFFIIAKLCIEVGLIITTVLLGYGLFGAVFSLLISRMAFSLILLLLVLKKIGIKLPNFSKTKEYLSFSLPRVVSSVSYLIVTSSDKYLIGFFLGVLFVGYYAPAYAMGNVLNFFLYPLFFILPVVMSKSFEENKISEIKIYLKYSLKYFLIIAIPSVLGLSLLSRSLLEILSTKEIAENSYYITPFIALSILIYGVGSLIGQILIVVKKTKIIGTIWMIAALSNLGLNIIFIPKFGILGAALTTLFAYGLAFGLICYFSFKELKFGIDWKFIVKSILASVIMTLFIFWFNPAGLLNTAIAVVVSVFIYGILIMLLGGFSKKEINFLKGFIS